MMHMALEIAADKKFVDLVSTSVMLPEKCDWLPIEVQVSNAFVD